jgi:uridine kinase
MIVKHIQRVLREKSDQHSSDLEELGKSVSAEPLSPMVMLAPQTPQFVAMSTIIQNPHTNQEDYTFYLDRLATLLIAKCVSPILHTVLQLSDLPQSSGPCTL